MDNVNIFDEVVKGKFFSFSKIGDAVQGTFIDKYEARDTYQNEQIVYVLKDKNGIVHNVGIKKTNTILNEQLAPAKLGFIVGLRYEEDKPSKKNPGKMAKIIRPYFDHNIVDHAWMNEQAKKNAGIVNTPTQTETPVTPAIPVVEATPVIHELKKREEMMNSIRELSVKQGLTQATDTPSVKDDKITSYTQLPLTEDNFTPTIIKLSGYTSPESIPF